MLDDEAELLGQECPLPDRSFRRNAEGQRFLDRPDWSPHDRPQALGEMTPVVQDERSLPKSIELQQLFGGEAARRLPMKSAKEQMLRDLEELAVEAQLSQETHIGADERAKQGCLAQGADAHDAVLRITEVELLPQASQAFGRPVFHKVQAGVLAR